MNAGAADLHAILAFYVESGVDAVLQEEPVDRLSGRCPACGRGCDVRLPAMPGTAERASGRSARRRYRGGQPRVRPQRCGG